jgi:hypothetical protein
MFNTLRYAKRLEEVGVSRNQAEAHIQIIAEIVEDDVATKQDLKELEHRLVIRLSTIMMAIVSLVATIATIAAKLH